MEENNAHGLPEWLDLPDGQWRTCISENVDHYMDQLYRARQGVRMKFNIHACLFGPTWMFFRKMYLVAGCTLILFLASFTALALVNRWIIPFEWLRVTLAILHFVAAPILVGLFSDRAYLWHVARIIQTETAPHAFRTPQQINARLALKGGTSWGSTLALIVGTLIFLGIIGQIGQH